MPDKFSYFYKPFLHAGHTVRIYLFFQNGSIFDLGFKTLTCQTLKRRGFQNTKSVLNETPKVSALFTYCKISMTCNRNSVKAFRLIARKCIEL